MSPRTTALKSSAADRVRGDLMARILTGELPPGTPLRELHLAAELGVSQAPVREALRELSALGLVETQPYRGSRVRAPTRQEVQEAYAVRAVLEGLAGRLAAPRLRGDTALLEELAAEVLTAAQQQDVQHYATIDALLHHEIVAASGNAVLTRTWEGLHLAGRVQIRLTGSQVDLIEAQSDHWVILEALNAGQGERAGELLQAHVERFSTPEHLP